MVICPSCKNQVRELESSCSHCGASLVYKCSKCGERYYIAESTIDLNGDHQCPKCFPGESTKSIYEKKNIVNEENNYKENQLGFISGFFSMIKNPVKYFRNYLALNDVDLGFFTIWVVGISQTFQRVLNQLFKTSSNDGFWYWIGENWINTWIFVSFFAVINGYIILYLGSWFFRVRLLFSKGIWPSKENVRYVFMNLSLIHSIPTLIYFIIATFIYKNVKDYNESDAISFFLFNMVTLVEAYYSYKVAYQVYNAKRGRAWFWFLGLPIIGIITGILVLMFVL